MTGEYEQKEFRLDEYDPREASTGGTGQGFGQNRPDPKRMEPKSGSKNGDPSTNDPNFCGEGQGFDTYLPPRIVPAVGGIDINNKVGGDLIPRDPVEGKGFTLVPDRNRRTR